MQYHAAVLSNHCILFNGRLYLVASTFSQHSLPQQKRFKFTRMLLCNNINVSHKCNKRFEKLKHFKNIPQNYFKTSVR